MTATLAGTVALVTGASSGIGAATARAMAAQGAAVALLARRADRLRRTGGRDRSGGRHGAGGACGCDRRRPGRRRRAAAVGELGRLDILVNNAGLMRMGDAAEAPLKDWDDLVAVNIQGVLYATRASLPHLIAAAADSPRGVADVVTISSTAGRVARPNTAVYSLTKFGVNAFSEGIRQELIGKRVRVGIVGPGTVETEITDHLPARSAGSLQPADCGHGQTAAGGHRRSGRLHGHPGPQGRGQRDAGSRRRADLVNDGWVTGDRIKVAFPATPLPFATAVSPFSPTHFTHRVRWARQNRVARIALCEEVPGGSTGRKMVLDVEYEEPQPGLPTELFVKFSRDFDDPIRDRGRTQMESEVKFARCP